MNNQINIVKSGNFLNNVRLELVRNKKPLILGVSSIWGLYIIAGIFMGYNHTGGGGKETFIFAFMAQLIAIVVASLAFTDMKRKEERIYSLMIPASVNAKFITRWIGAVPLLFVLLVIGFYLGDFARISTFAISNAGWKDCPEYMKVFNPWIIFAAKGDLNDGVLACCIAFGSYFFSQSIYFFGAILWPKLSFIKTLASLYVIQTVLGIFLMLVHRFGSFSLSFLDVRPLLWVMFAVLVVMTLVCYVLAYVRYSKSQVVYKLF